MCALVSELVALIRSSDTVVKTKASSRMIETVATESSGSPADLKKTRRTRVNIVDPSKIDRLPPHSLEAEQGVLGCILLSPSECLGECITKLKTGSDVFYDLRHCSIYETMVEMYDSKVPVDTITLQQRLKDKQQPDSRDSLAFRSALPD